MRILVIQETDWLERGPHQQHHLVDRMALRGHDVRVIDYEFTKRADFFHPSVRKRRVYPCAPKVFNDAHVTLVRPAAIKGAGISTLSILYYQTREIRRQIREFQPDVIIAFGILNASIGMALAHRHGIPFVYYLIDHLHTLLPSGLMRVIAKQVEKQNIQQADKVLVINKGLKDYAVLMGCNPHKISIVTAGVDFERFNPSISGSAIRRKYGIKADETLLLFAGFIYSFSGVREVVESLHKAESDHLKLMVVGEGDLYPDLLKMSAASELKNRLILTGRVPFDEMPDHLAAADICLLPAHKNDTMDNIVPIKMYEYLAMGKPVIATSLSGIRKEFGSDRGVLYVDRSENVVEKAREIAARGLDEEGERARKAVENLDWSTIVDTFERTLAEVLDAHDDFVDMRKVSTASTSN